MKTNIRAKYGTTTTALLSVGHREVYRSKKGLLMNWDKIKETKAYQRFSVFARSNFEYVMRKDYWEIDVCIVNGEKIYTDVREEELSGVLKRFFDEQGVYIIIYLWL